MSAPAFTIYCVDSFNTTSYGRSVLFLSLIHIFYVCTIKSIDKIICKHKVVYQSSIPNGSVKHHLCG